LCVQVLDAPALQDDFYLNLVDWSAQNVLAVGLGSCVYLWSACTSKVRCMLIPKPGPDSQKKRERERERERERWGKRSGAGLCLSVVYVHIPSVFHPPVALVSSQSQRGREGRASGRGTAAPTCGLHANEGRACFRSSMERRRATDVGSMGMDMIY
jgi:hypothetical protein